MASNFGWEAGAGTGQNFSDVRDTPSGAEKLRAYQKDLACSILLKVRAATLAEIGVNESQNNLISRFQIKPNLKNISKN